MQLRTEYLGFALQNPFLIGASPIVYDLDNVKRLEDEGASGVVMHSLFEEQIVRENVHGILGESRTGIYPESVRFPLHPDAYLKHLQRLKETLSIPVIASLNGIHLGTWSDYARMIESAGADALEVNLYFPPSGDMATSNELESAAQDIVRAVYHAVNIPIAVKLTPFYAGLARFIARLHEAGARSVVLFNSFLQPDLNLDSMKWNPQLPLSEPDTLLLRIQWLATLYGRVSPELSLSGGVHSHADAIKGLAAGASTVQIVSALLKDGPGALSTLIQQVKAWMQEKNYVDVNQLRGSMSFSQVSDTCALGRAAYLRMLQSWKKTD